MLFVSILGPRLWLIVLMVGISHMPRIARVTRAATVELVARDFVRAAAAMGVPKRKILLFEVLPNISSPLLVEFGLRLTYSIIMIAALSFIGFGMQPPAADWGLMINENRIAITVQPWAVVAPVSSDRRPHHQRQPHGRWARPGHDGHRQRHGADMSGAKTDVVLSVEDLRVILDPSGIEIDDGVSFAIHQGEVLGLVGESASGKTTAATSLLAYQRRGAKVADGRIDIAGTDVLSASRSDLRRIRGGLISYVPQDASASLNPALRIGDQLMEILSEHSVRLLERRARGPPQADDGRSAAAQRSGFLATVPAPALRGPAATGGDRDGHGQPAQGHRPRRAHDCSRCDHSGARPGDGA